jgi:hypothetical protein
MIQPYCLLCDPMACHGLYKARNIALLTFAFNEI